MFSSTCIISKRLGAGITERFHPWHQKLLKLLRFASSLT
jgi:hypothetical protein